MNFYDRWVLPPILDLVMRQNQLEKYRREVVAAANGRVLEVGVGSGLYFPLYGKQVETEVGIDPSPRLLAIASRRVSRPINRLLFADANEIPITSDLALHLAHLQFGDGARSPCADQRIDCPRRPCQQHP